MIARLSSLVIFVVLLSPAQWSKISFPTNEFLWKVRFATEQTGWIAGHTFIYRTTNGGQTWTPRDSTKGAVFAMAVVNDSTLLYANSSTASFPGRGIRRTTDNGSTWTIVDTNKHYYDDIMMVNASVGYACGIPLAANSRPIVRKTTDGGATWTTASQNFPKGKYELTGLSFIDVNTGWGVTYDGFVYKTTNGGSDWSLLDSVGANSYRDIAFINQNYGWIVGGISGNQKLAYTTNGGTSWTVIEQHGSSTREVEFVDSNNVWFAGSNNAPPFIAHYDTVGGSWKMQDINDKFTGVESIDMLNTKTGYAVGGQGAVYKTTTGGVLAVRPEKLTNAPVNFSLAQNFPNPFNPSTTMAFSLPAPGMTTLKVHAVTGQMVEQIFAQQMEAGSYRIQWNAAAVPSGVYFYTLTSGTFTQTKRLVLLK
jgi:photosystem II stability/assembly factor-like uncharacterized protein